MLRDIYKAITLDPTGKIQQRPNALVDELLKTRVVDKLKIKHLKTRNT